jgi:hypothetical protein
MKVAGEMAKLSCAKKYASFGFYETVFIYTFSY